MAGQSDTPLDYALNVANHYADTLEGTEYEYPYTISVFDMAHYAAMKNSINELGTELADYVKESPIEHSEALRDGVRRTVQKYDSGNYILEETDDYVDLGHLAHELSSMGGAIAQAADAVNASLAKFVELTRNKSGEHEENGEPIFIDLEKAQGLAIYYPYSAQTAGTALKVIMTTHCFPHYPTIGAGPSFSKLSFRRHKSVVPRFKKINRYYWHH